MSTTDEIPATHCTRCGDPIEPGAEGQYCGSMCRTLDAFQSPLNLP